MTAQVDAYTKHENSAATHLIGQDWQKLIDMIESRPGENEVKSFDGGGSQYQYRAEDNVLRTLQDVKRLRQKDMPLFGRCPETDNFYTVVCSSCSMILMPHALKEHYEKRHGTVSKSHSPNEKQIPESPNKSKSKKVHPQAKPDKSDKSKRVKATVNPLTDLTVEAFKDSKRPDKSKKGKPTEKPVEQGPGPGLGPDPVNQRSSDRGKQKGSRLASELQPIVALSPIQVVETESESNDSRDLPKNKKRDKKKSEKKPDKIYDPDKHCGVINDSGRPCVRSILCKVHQVALKRAVPSRTMPYDMLIRILKSQNDEEKIKSENTTATSTTTASSTPASATAPVRLPKPESGEKVSPEAKETQNGDVQPQAKAWTSDQTSIKKEEPPTKRLKVKEEIPDEEEIDQNQFALPSHLEALIDETLKTLKDVEEGESLPVAPIAPKPEPLVRWDFDPEEAPRKSPSPPPHIFLEDIHWHSSHPKPLATNTFGCRLIGGLMSTCKKLDTLRKHLQSVWTASATSPPSIRSGFNEVYGPGQGQQATNPAGANSKNGFPPSKYQSKKPNQSKSGKKNVAPVLARASVGKRKRRSNSNLVQNATSNASDIISGLLISNPVAVRGSPAGSASVSAIPTGVIPVNPLAGSGGVPLRLFQGSLPVIASTSPNQPATFIQLNLCPPK